MSFRGMSLASLCILMHRFLNIELSTVKFKKPESCIIFCPCYIPYTFKKLTNNS